MKLEMTHLTYILFPPVWTNPYMEIIGLIQNIITQFLRVAG